MSMPKELITMAFHGAGLCKAVMAQPVSVGPFVFYVHRISYKAWSVTEKTTGMAIASGRTALDAVNKAILKVGTAGEVVTRAMIEQAKKPPPPEGLEMFVPAKKVEKPHRMNVTDKEFPSKVVAKITEIMKLNAREQAAVGSAIIFKGQYAGMLKARPPSRYDNELGYAAWMGLQPNAFKVSVGGIMCLTLKAKDFVLKLASKTWPAWLDRDSQALSEMGVWP